MSWCADARIGLFVGVLAAGCGADPVRPPSGPPARPSGLRPWNGEATGSVFVSAALRPRFRWAGPGNSARYDLQVDDSCATPGFSACLFPSPEIDEAGLTETAFTPGFDLGVSTTRPVGRRYYWRVRACNASGCSEWSPVRYVDVGRQWRDLNGDGYADVIVGDPANDDVANGAGQVAIFLGGPSMDDLPDVTVNGAAESSGLGGQIAAAGDLDADGYFDLVVSTAPSEVLVLRGGAAPDSTPDLILTAQTPDERMDGRVAGVGDVDGDGFADIVATATSPDRSAKPLRVHLFLGGTSMDAAADITLTPDSLHGGLNRRIAGGGDVNGDGYAEILVGDEVGRFPAGSSERLLLYLGGSPMDLDPDLVVESSPDQYGADNGLGTAGDVDGDGYGDVFFANVGYDGGPGFGAPGQAFAFFGGPGVDAVPDLVFTAAEMGDSFGGAPAAAGDLNGDGYPDLVIGAERSDVGGEPDVGRAYVFFGASTMDTTADIVVSGMRAGDSLGSAVASAGDVDGDGFADLVVSAARVVWSCAESGRVLLLRGNPAFTGQVHLVFNGSGTANCFGRSLW